MRGEAPAWSPDPREPRNPTSQGILVQPHRSRSLHLATIAFACLVACGGSDGASESAAKVPSRAGDVWEIDGSAGRAASPAALLAFVNGMHVLIIDGDDVFAGTQLIKSNRAPDGVRTLQLADGSSADLVPNGDAFELRFASGERIPLRKHAGASQ
ncbi:MAG: hypothetical protein JWL61_4787 [Gemmatimonadetes bacterium]|nr:hypothetical protein [Gemmatimonadota bacterium]